MHILTLFAHNPRAWTGAGNHTYLLRTSEATLIDAGEGAPEHVDAVAAAAGDLPLARVLVTHGHVDHASGAATLAARFPGASFHKLPWPERDGCHGVPWQPLRDGEVVDVGGAGLWVLHTPGHSPDHVCLFEPDSGVLFAGDLVMNGGTVVIPPSHGGNLRHYLASLRAVLDLQPRRILPAHGAPIENPGALLRSYLAHRAMRERQIVDALGGGPQTLEQLVGRIYHRLDPKLRDAAEESVLAHLIKLEEEGGASRDVEGEVTRWRRP
jgi:glyoxylase-like metal-dependent hydrolase (beta-lactamase superfamily II)